MPTAAVVLIEGFADWERAPVAALLAGFDVEVVHVTPGGVPVTSIGRLQARPSRALEALRIEDFDALVLIGAEGWQVEAARGLVAPLAIAAHRAGKIVAGICGATLVLAEGGLLEGRAHTSNGLAFLEAHLPAYGAAATYVDDARAVSTDRLVTASGLAPISFAAEVARLLAPERTEEIAGFEAMMGAEHREG